MPQQTTARAERAERDRNGRAQLGRDRSSTKAYVESLFQDIEALQDRLRRAGQEPPPPQNPLIQQRLSQPLPDCHAPVKVSVASAERFEDLRPGVSEHTEITSCEDPRRVCSCCREMGKEKDAIRHEKSPTAFYEVQDMGHNAAPLVHGNKEPSESGSNSRQISGVDRQRLAHSLFSPNQIALDRTSGKIKYFCPINLFKRYTSDILNPTSSAKSARPLDKQIHRILADVPAPLQDYLMGLFWTRYNATFGIIDKEAFSEDLNAGSTVAYSAFLHIVCLAMGFIFADKKSRAVRTVTLSDNSSIFQREIKYLFEGELEEPRGLTTIQAILVLSDLECALGRDDVGAMYASIACRLCFDYGLNLEHSQLLLSPRELQSRRKLLRSCILHDRGWSLYLGRPTNIKTSDLDISEITDTLSHLTFGESEHALQSTAPEQIEDQILKALLELLEIASKVQQRTHSDVLPGTTSAGNSLIEIAALGRQLDSWAARLPSPLRWTPENAGTAPPLFFVMHQQFHTTQVLLHGPYGQYGEALQELYGGTGEVEARSPPNESQSFLPLARSIAFKNATMVVQIFASYRARFGRVQHGIFSLTHAATAILVLTADATLNERPGGQGDTLQRVRLLLNELRDMALFFQPAGMMTTVMEHYLRNIGVDLSVLPLPGPSLTLTLSTVSSRDRRGSDQEVYDDALDGLKKRPRSDDAPSMRGRMSFDDSYELGPQSSAASTVPSQMPFEEDCDDLEIIDRDMLVSDCPQLTDISRRDDFQWPGNLAESSSDTADVQPPDYTDLLSLLLPDDGFDVTTHHHTQGDHLGDDLFLGFQNSEVVTPRW